jgi:hypothetical protein
MTNQNNIKATLGDNRRFGLHKIQYASGNQKLLNQNVGSNYQQSLEVLKYQGKSIHKTIKDMVNVFFHLTNAMCHAFNH